MTEIPAIETEGLTKRFGEFTAVADLDLRVDTGTVVSLLGPNGAGKTTTVRMLATLLRPDAGYARVAGHDVVARGGAGPRADLADRPVRRARQAPDRAREPRADGAAARAGRRESRRGRRRS